jgi:hypothetical protein
MKSRLLAVVDDLLLELLKTIRIRGLGGEFSIQACQDSMQLLIQAGNRVAIASALLVCREFWGAREKLFQLVDKASPGGQISLSLQPVNLWHQQHLFLWALPTLIRMSVERGYRSILRKVVERASNYS